MKWILLLFVVSVVLAYLSARQWLPRIVAMFWDRANVALGWPFLFFIDIFIASSGVQTWRQARRSSKNALMEIWNRNARGRAAA